MSYLAYIVVLVQCLLNIGLAEIQHKHGYTLYDTVSVVKGRSLLQESFADLIIRYDVDTAPFMLQAMASDLSSAALVAESLNLITDDAEKAYIFSDNFARAFVLGDDVAAFLAEVVLQAEAIAPSLMAEVIVAAVSQGVSQTDVMVDLLALVAENSGCAGFATIIAEAYDFAQSQGKTRDLAETLGQAGAAAACALCEDYEPSEDATCAERKEWGECEAEWMIFGYFCASTCGYCRANQKDFAKSVAVRPRPSVAVDSTPTAEPSAPVLKPVPVSRVRGPSVTQNLEQAIASGATKVAAANLLDFVEDGLSEEVGDGLLSIAPEYVTATTLTLTLALRSVKPEQEEALFAVFFKLLPVYPDIVANAIQQAARKKSGLSAAGNLLLQILGGNEGQFPSLIDSAAANCNGIPQLVEYMVEIDDQTIAPFVQDNDAVLTCLETSDQVLSALSAAAAESVGALPIPAREEQVGMPATERATPSVPRTPVVISDNELGGIASGNFDEAVGVLVSSAVQAQETGDTSVFTGSLNELILGDEGNQVTLAIAAAFLGDISEDDKLALSIGLSEVVSFSTSDVSPIIASGLAIAQIDGGCDTIEVPVKIISEKASEQNSTDRWGVALGRHPEIVTECLGDEIRLCTGFAQRDCCELDIKPQRCNFCGFQFNLECRFELEKESIPSLEYYVYRDKRFNDILCKCSNILTA